MELWTSTEAARQLGVHRDTTRRAAASGQVPGAHQEPRPGSIQAPWVATREAWEYWYTHRRPAGRPRREREEDAGVVPTNAREAWTRFLDGCGADGSPRTEEEFMALVHQLGLAYWIEGAHVQPEGAEPESWETAYTAMYETGWAWDATVPDEAVVQEYERRMQG